MEIEHLPAGTFTTGGVKGLYIRKTPRQSFFFLRYADKSGRHDLSLGSYPATSLAEARQSAERARELIRKGISPLEHRRTMTAKVFEEIERARIQEESAKRTFQRVANEWIADREESGYWRMNRRGAKEPMRMLSTYVFPAIGDKPIETITHEDAKNCVGAIWRSKPQTAERVLGYMRKIIQWAIAHGYRTDPINPASLNGSLGVLLESFRNDRKLRENYAACSIEELPDLIVEMLKHKEMIAQAAVFAILTAARFQAVRLAQWLEFDLENGVWEIPLEHDKMKAVSRSRKVILSPHAVRFLKELKINSSSTFVFPNSRGGHYSESAINTFIKKLHLEKKAKDGIGWIDPVKTKVTGGPCVITIHGTARATFRTWAKDDRLENNRKFDQEAVELCLLHERPDVYRGAYDRSALTEERKNIMNEWAKFLFSKIDKWN